jgi:hypothetical protein
VGKAKRAHHLSDDRVMVGTAHARLCPPCGAWGTHDTRESASFTRAKHLQLGNAIFGAVEPPTKLAALHHHHIGKRPNPTGRTGGLFLAAIPDILANRSVR